MKMRMTAIAAAVAVGLGLAGEAPAVTVEVVMANLDNPRGLAFAPNGALYVTEAGHGGPDNGPLFPNCAVNGAGEKRCYGPTGAVTRLWKGEQQRVVEGLPSHAVYDHPNQVVFPNGGAASGPNRISFQGTGGAYITFGLGGDDAFQSRLSTGGPFFGTLVQMAASGRWQVVADILAHEDAQNPGGGAIDSNPFGLLAEPGVRHVVDAGGNSLLAAYGGGRIETLAVFPPRAGPLGPMDSVPTSVARGPDGALYVGELTGFPFPVGAANIYRVVPGAAPQVHLGGFQAIMDLAFDDDGNLFVVEHSSGAFPPPPALKPNTGKLTKIDPAGVRTVLKADLNRPTALAIGPDGAIYVTHNGVVAGTGQVLKITP